ncbi:hypothetical protein QBC47DRAFT_193749 [Echria macrotheca]|uniref:Uncharacterized protein n=1 Tax=Echria macrotheca TaxID=438768 RepID=A0AAJ0BGZ7_9PEZI|nr:hypothetical protein QBC47DRAFT_193749 [Echria macrotheca]
MGGPHQQPEVFDLTEDVDMFDDDELAEAYDTISFPQDKPDDSSATVTNPEPTRPANGDLVQQEPTTRADPNSSLLLEKASLTFSSTKPGGGFEFGPAARISVANFTRMPSKPLPVHPFPEDQPPQPQKPAQTRIAGPLNFSLPSARPNLGPTVAVPATKDGDDLKTLQVHEHAVQASRRNKHQLREFNLLPGSPMIGNHCAVTTTIVPVLSPARKQSATTIELPDKGTTQAPYVRSPASPMVTPQQNKQQVKLKSGMKQMSNLPTIFEQAMQHRPTLPAHYGGGQEETQISMSRRLEGVSDRNPTSAPKSSPLPFPDAYRQSAHNFPVPPQVPLASQQRGASGKPTVAETTSPNKGQSKDFNISKRRSRHHHTSRASEAASDIPSSSPPPNTPVPQKSGRIEEAFLQSLAGVVNNFTSGKRDEQDDERKRFMKYIKKLRYQRQESENELRTYVGQLNAQAKKIELQKKAQATLEEEMRRKEEQIQDKEGELQAMEEQMRVLEDEVSLATERVRKIEEKYTVCKDHLNSAIEEQQQLYTRSKKQCEDAIQQMHNMEKSQRELVELTSRTTEAVREQMLEKVRQTVAQSNEEMEKLREEIEGLRKEVDTKSAELASEKENSRILLQKLEDLQAASVSFEKLASQNQDILQKLELQIKTTSERDQSLETKTRFEAMRADLSGLSKLVSEESKILRGLHQGHRESMDSLGSKVGTVLESQKAVADQAAAVTTAAEAHVKSILDKLDQFRDMSDELQRRAEESGMLASLLKATEDMKKVLEAEVNSANLQIHTLEEELSTLEMAERKNAEMESQIRLMGDERNGIVSELKSARGLVEKLENQLRSRDQTQRSEAERFAGKITQLAQIIRGHEAGASTLAEQAAEVARREERFKSEKIVREMSAALEKVEQQKASVIQELENARQELRQRDERIQSFERTVESLDRKISDSERDNVNMVEGMKKEVSRLTQLSLDEREISDRLRAELSSIQSLTKELKDANTQESLKTQAFVNALRNLSEQENVTSATSEIVKELCGNVTSRDLEEKLPLIFSQFLKKPCEHEGTASSAPPTVVVPQDEGTGVVSDDRMPLVRHLSLDVTLSPFRDESAMDTAMIETQMPGPLTLSQDQMRRAMVCSPAIDQPEPNPPSVAQEKILRRQAVQPKSIIKSGSQSSESTISEEIPVADLLKLVEEHEPAPSSTAPRKQTGNGPTTGQKRRAESGTRGRGPKRSKSSQATSIAAGNHRDSGKANGDGGNALMKPGAEHIGSMVRRSSRIHQDNTPRMSDSRLDDSSSQKDAGAVMPSQSGRRGRPPPGSAPRTKVYTSQNGGSFKTNQNASSQSQSYPGFRSESFSQENSTVKSYFEQLPSLRDSKETSSQ